MQVNIRMSARVQEAITKMANERAILFEDMISDLVSIGLADLRNAQRTRKHEGLHAVDPNGDYANRSRRS